MTSLNAKATPAPPRFKEGEAPPLPQWPINWSCIGICIETLLSIDPATLVEKVNNMRPAYSMAIVDASVMTLEEMAIDPPTNLGVKLKSAKAIGDSNWLTPQLLSEVFEARSILDKDDEHRKEFQRRIDAAKICKKEIEEALAQEAKAKQQFEASFLQLKDLEDKEREARKLKEQSLNITTIGGTTVLSTKQKSLLAPVKGDLPSTPINGLKEEKKILEDKTTNLRALLQCYETKVKVAQYWDVKRDSEKDHPMTTTRIYWCIGFGNSAEILSQQLTVKNIFQAIFNLAKKPPPPLLEPEDETQTLPSPKTTKSGNVPTVQTPVPKLIEELQALKSISKPDHPSRKLPIMNVLYEDPPPLEEEIEDKNVKVPNKGIGSSSSKKSIQSAGGLSYEEVAKAIIDAVINLKQQIELFVTLEAMITEKCTIPEAKPSQDVDMTYYKDILDEVPKNLISIPIIVHCIVAQVSVYECPSEDLKTIKVAKANKYLARGLQNTFQKLGQGLSCMRKPYKFILDLMERVEMEGPKEASQKALQTSNLYTLETNKNVSKTTLNALQETSNVTTGKLSTFSNNLERRNQDSKCMNTFNSFSKLGSTIDNSTPQDPRILLAINEVAAMRDDVSQISELSEGSSTKTQKDEEHLLIVHEFHRVGRLEARQQQQQQILEFWNSIDAIKVEKFMLSLLASPGKNRAYMPIYPFLTKEKRHECLKALEMFASGGRQTSGKDDYPLYKELDDIYGPPVILEILEDPNGPSFPLVPVNVATVQRRRKLKLFLEMLLNEQKRVFHALDTETEETPSKSICSEDVDIETDDDGLTDRPPPQEPEGGRYLVDCGCPGVKIYRYPTPPPEIDPSSKSMASSIQPTSIFPLFQKILNRNLIESISNSLWGEIYGRATTHLPYRVRRYDRDDDSLLEALYADERNHEWRGSVASEMGFGDFVANMDSPPESMVTHKKHVVYDIEPQDGTIVERFRCHLTENQGLVWTGLPAKSTIQWEPQTSIIKDGNMIFLRGYSLNDNFNTPPTNSILAILRDGLVVCFFIAEDGTMSLQISNSENETVEINSMGVILMFPSERFVQQDLRENITEEETPLNNSSLRNETVKDIPQKTAKEVTKDISKSIPKEDEGGGVAGEKSSNRICNVQSIKDILLEESGDTEAWRCVLPTGTIIRYKDNGDAQVLCRQGNVSNWKNGFEGGSCWITANNEGFFVMQQDSSFEEKNPPKLTNIDVQLEDSTKPVLTQLNDLKVVHLYDPDTRDEIMTREDLVVVVTCEEKHSQLVQHADGTHIYSEVWEFFPREPVEVVIPPKHIYDWPTSCPQDQMPALEEEEDILECQNSSEDDNEKSSNVVEDKDNTHVSFDENEISGTNGINAKRIIKKNSNNSKDTTTKRSYQRKTPLRGLLANDPNKIGAQLSKFAEAQKEHSQTWAPEGYGEAPRDIPHWVWPLQPPTHCRERYSTPLPEEEISMSVQHKSNKPHFSTLWHVRKDGFAKVHGKIGFGTCIEFTTEDGHYVATWSKKNSQLTLTMPGGATLHSNGNVVTYNSSSTSNKHDNVLEIKTQKKDLINIESSIQKENLTQIKPFIEEKDLTQLENSAQETDSIHANDLNIENTRVQTLNTYDAYVFDVFEGSLIHTNNMGSGFKIFGRGCDFESIANGNLASQIAKEATDLQNSFLNSSFNEIEKFSNDNDSNNYNLNAENNIGGLQQSIKNFEDFHQTKVTKECDSERPLEINSSNLKKNEFGKSKLMIKEGQVGKSFDPFDGFDLEPPGTWKPTPTSTPTPIPSEPPELTTLGPLPRLFVIQDGGYGYEILADEMYEMYEIAKSYNKYCTKEDDKSLINGEDCIVHTFITNEDKCKMNVNELLKDEEKMQTSFPITPWLLTRKVSQFTRRFQAKQRNTKVQYQTNCDWLQLEFTLPILPRIINPIVPNVAIEIENSTFVYRQILETPTISDETCKNIDKILEAYTNWLLENIDRAGCDIGLDTSTDCEIEIKKWIARCKQEILSEKEGQKAQKLQKIQVQDARRIIRKVLRESTQKTTELNRQQRLLQFDIDEDWRVFVEEKRGFFQCMHKPTDLLQTKPPFRPLPNTRFLFFHAEEGLKYLFICQQKENEAKQWSIETMSPSSKSSICSNDYFQNLSKSEEKELANIFSGMIEKVEEMSKEVLEAENNEKKRKEEEKFCKQVFSEVLIQKDPFRDFTGITAELEDEDEQCIFDYPPILEKPPKPRPLHIYEFCPTVPPLKPSLRPPSPLQVFLPPLPQTPKVSPKLKTSPLDSSPKPLEISINEKNKIAREAWHAQRMAIKAARSKILGPNWDIPHEFDYDYEIYMRAKAFKKAFRNAPWKSNQFYINRELPNKRLMQVQSYERMKLAHNPLPSEWINRQFRIFPPIIDFHIVQLGTMRMKIVVVQNYHGPQSGRIFIHKEDKLSIKFHYFHGSIAPGMYTMLRVYFRASKLGVHCSQFEIKTEMDVFRISIKAFVISGKAPPDPDDQMEETVRNPCDECIDPWGALILCRRCLTHHLHWWSKNWGLYECTKCWHFHITQEWLDAIAEKARQKRVKDEAKKANR